MGGLMLSSDRMENGSDKMPSPQMSLDLTTGTNICLFMNRLFIYSLQPWSIKFIITFIKRRHEKIPTCTSWVSSSSCDYRLWRFDVFVISPNGRWTYYIAKKNIQLIMDHGFLLTQTLNGRKNISFNRDKTMGTPVVTRSMAGLGRPWRGWLERR